MEETLLQGDIDSCRMLKQAGAGLQLELCGWLTCGRQQPAAFEVGVPGLPMVTAELQPQPPPRQGMYRFRSVIPVHGAVPSSFPVYFLLRMEAGYNIAARLDGTCEPEQPHRVDTATQQGAFMYSNAYTRSRPPRFAPCAAPDVSVIMVLHNRLDRTLAALHSLAALREVQFELLLVDNASTDGTRELLQQIEGATIISNEENVHFIRACNQAARAARGECLLFLNNDTELLPGTLRAAWNCLRSEARIGAVGGRILNPDGSLQEAGSLLLPHGGAVPLGRGADAESPEHMFRREVDYCSASFLLTPRAVFSELGGFDEQLGVAYYEDADYCLRLAQSGYRVVYEPDAALVHYEHSSSSAPDEARCMQFRSRFPFLQKHRQFLLERQAQKLNRDRRILVLDDKVPLDWHGSGMPRAAAIVRVLAELGLDVTVFPTHGSSDSWRDIYRQLPRQVEVLRGHSKETLRELLCRRRGLFRWIWVSRPHTMELLEELQRVEPRLLEDAEVIYDVEAFYSIRELGRLALLTGKEASAQERSYVIEREIAYARSASRVAAVSDAEADEFLQRGFANVSVLGYGIEPAPTPTDYLSRKGILTVSPVHGEDSPNADGLRWFIEQCYPILGGSSRDLGLSVAGECRAPLPTDGIYTLVRFLGRVEDLSAVYDQHLLFVAPTRFGSGIPLKVVHAAAHGLPVVATSLLASQLGWHDGVELLVADHPDAFRTKIHQLCRDEQLWRTIRENALARVRQQFSPERFAAAVRSLLNR